MRKIYSFFFIVFLFTLSSCHSRPDKSANDSVVTEGVIKPTKLVANVYVENSGSMDGYVSEGTEFKDVLGSLLIKLKHHYGNPNLYFINSEIHQTEMSGDVTRFIQNLSPKTMHVGNTESSNLNSIFKQILKRTCKDTLSVFISDCVYSIQGTDSEKKLIDAKNLTMDAFLEARKANPDLAVIILKCLSKFNGYYYDRNNKAMKCNEDRPYYIFIIGKCLLVKNINQIIDLTDGKQGIKKLMNKYMISSQSCILNENSASIITSDYTNAARIKPMREKLGIEEIVMDKHSDSNLIFSVAVDTHDLLVDESYLTDRDNYEIIPADYKVTAVTKIGSDSPAKGDCENFSLPYAITIQSNGNYSPNISLRLKYKLPKWVYDSTIDDDKGIIPAPNQSFGLHNMMEGIFSAFFVDLNESKSIFELKFDINKIN